MSTDHFFGFFLVCTPSQTLVLFADPTASTDVIHLSASVDEASIEEILLRVVVEPLVDMKRIQLKAGTRIRFDKTICDASKLARKTNRWEDWF